MHDDQEFMRDSSCPGETGLTAPSEQNSGHRSLDRDQLGAFHKELRLRNPVFVWTVLIFNPVYVGWTAFDYLLVPDRWLQFLELRLIAAALTTAIAFWVSREANRKYSWEAVWLLAFIYCVAIAPMLPFAGGANLPRYVMGFVFVIITAGLIPFWPPRWPASAIFTSVAITCLIFLFLWSPERTPIGDVVSGAFIVITGSTLSVVASAFKYNLMRRDFGARLEISAVARRENKARMDLLRTSEELQTALNKLEELDRLKSKFFANISHELRTPLTLILAPLDQLEASSPASEGTKEVAVIRRNAERLLGLINDLLDLSRLDAGGLRLNIAEMDIRSVAAAVYESFAPSALAKRIEFTLDIEPATSKIWGDAHRLEMVVTNLVGNALKFTPNSGKIRLAVRDNVDGVLVEVEDSGPGIAAQDLDKVFDRFFQADPGDRRREGGVGIGLALARELVELHGGGISVMSEPGVSTTFSFSIPFGTEHIRPDVVERRKQFEQVPVLRRRGEDWVTSDAMLADRSDDRVESESEDVRVKGRKPRILLAEDHADVRDFIRTLLDPNCDVRTARTGLEAWRFISGDPPDLVVSDVMMPEMDGTELCRAIKSSPKLRNIPVILLTARVGSEATLEAYAHGADDFVAKPFHPRVLLARIQAQLKLRSFAIQLAEQEKMAVVGTLAAGILHEVRNPVNAIRNAARLLLAGRATADTVNQLLEVISDGAARIEAITSALDSHARPAEAGGASPSDVREGIDSTLRLLSHRMDGVETHLDYSTDRLIDAPSGPVNQVFMNIADNALRAGAKNLWISVEDRDDYVRVTIADDGPGIPPHVADRIFDPFFTAREDGTGTGLGLHISKRIVEQHGGRLWHETPPEGGAHFVIELPRVSQRTEAPSV